jgi:ribonucleoside-diphosphate reductase alpha chain
MNYNPPNYKLGYTQDSLDALTDLDYQTTRPSITHTFEIDGIQGYINVGLNPDGSPWEIFLTIQSEGSTLGGFADSFARLASTALQYGVPLEVICRRMIGQKFQPGGLVTKGDFKEADSIIDYVFKWIKLKFIDAKEINQT